MDTTTTGSPTWPHANSVPPHTLQETTPVPLLPVVWVTVPETIPHLGVRTALVHTMPIPHNTPPALKMFQKRNLMETRRKWLQDNHGFSHGYYVDFDSTLLFVKKMTMRFHLLY